MVYPYVDEALKMAAIVEHRPIEQHRIKTLRRHVCELVEAAGRETNADRRSHLLQLAASFARTADAVEVEA